jgi:hypothetical protein
MYILSRSRYDCNNKVYSGIGLPAPFLAPHHLWVGSFLSFLLRACNTSFPNYLFKSAIYRDMIKSSLYGNSKTLLLLRNIFEPIHVVLCNFGGQTRCTQSYTLQSLSRDWSLEVDEKLLLQQLKIFIDYRMIIK